MIIVQLDSEQLSSLVLNAVREALCEKSEPTEQEREELMTVQECSKYLSLSVPTIYTLISKGQLPVQKRSKRCYFFKSELNNYLKAGRKKMVIKEDPQKPLENPAQKKVLTSKSKRNND